MSRLTYGELYKEYVLELKLNPTHKGRNFEGELIDKNYGKSGVLLNLMADHLTFLIFGHSQTKHLPRKKKRKLKAHFYRRIKNLKKRIND